MKIIGLENYLQEGISLGNLVDYQDGAVVSKTIIKKTGGTVTVFAFSQGEGLSEHTAPFDAMVYIVDGKAAITVAGTEYNVSQGEMIIMPANKPHSLKAPEPFKMLLIMIIDITYNMFYCIHFIYFYIQ